MSANRIKKKIAERTLELKEKSAEVQKQLHIEQKRLQKLNEQLKIAKDDTKKQEKTQLEMAERGQGKQTAVREAEMYRAKRCSQLETRLSRTREKFSRTEDENQQIRSKIDELRRLIMMQTEVYQTCQARLRRIQGEQADDLLHSDNVLYERDLLTKKIEDIVEKNNLEVEASERLLIELRGYIDREAKASKEFYERQMKETPVFDDSFKENMVSEIRQRALTYAEEKKTEQEIEDDLQNIKDAFARLRDEAIGDQSLEDAVEQYLRVESDCIKIMSYIRAKEVEVEVVEEMTDKFKRDAETHRVANELLLKRMEEVDVLRRERDGIQEEEDRLKSAHGNLNQKMGRWAQALNSVFKAMSVDLEQLGIYGGRVTADADLVMLMGVVEAKSQKVLNSFNKFVKTGGLQRTGLSSAAAIESALRSEPNSPTGLTNASVPPPGPPAGMASPQHLSLPSIPAAAFGGGSPQTRNDGQGYASFSDEDEGDDMDSDDDEEDFVKPMSSVDLKRSLQNTLSVSSIAMPKSGGGFGL